MTSWPDPRWRAAEDDVLDFIHSFPSAGERVLRGASGFEHSLAFLRSLGSPQDRSPSVQIVGTSGKGTVAYALAQVLVAHGHRVGLSVSPHVYDYRERMQVDLRLPAWREVASAVNRCLPVVRALTTGSRGAPTFFELTLAVAWTVFDQAGVGYAVIEAGLGGRLDTSNCITRDDKVVIVTDIGLDHTEVLGDTVTAIAGEKLAVLERAGACVVYPQRHTDAQRVADRWRSRPGLDFRTPPPNLCGCPSCQGTAPRHRRLAHAAALSAAALLAARDGWRFDQEAAEGSLAGLDVPGRYERGRIGRVPVVLDGAHNPDKIQALIESLVVDHPAGRFQWILSLGRTKDLGEVVRLIEPFAQRLVLTEHRVVGGDVPVRESVGAKEAAAVARRILGAERVEIAPDHASALQVGLVGAGPEVPVVVTGSFMILDSFRALVGARAAGATADPAGP